MQSQSLSRNPVRADRAYATVDECEPDGFGGVVSTTTVFLTASECPVGCVMCDLWQNTLSVATPLGAIPKQLEYALADRHQADWLKLYNSGNFFDSRSIPPEDYPAIANHCNGYSRVVVENHPRFGRDQLARFRDHLDARIEVAVGLETVQPRWLHRLGKKMTRDDFGRYASWLSNQDVDLRVFLIVGVPGISVSEAMAWATLSARHAAQCGARHISLIPARAGHGWNGQADLLPETSHDQLNELHATVIDKIGGSLDQRCVVTVDVWDLDGGQQAVKEIAARNLSQDNSPVFHLSTDETPNR